MLLGVDVGGTFTDAALLDGDRLHTAKVPTTPGDQSEGVMTAIEAVLARAEAPAGEIESFTHGMTVGTNALLERRGAKTALIATEGFADMLEIGRQNRPSLYHLCRARPEPLVPPELRVEARERIGAEGVVTELTGEEDGTAGRRRPRLGRRVRRGVPALLLRGPGTRAEGRRGASRGASRGPRLGVVRGAAGLPRVRALLDDRDRRLSLPPPRLLPRAARGGLPRAGRAGARGDALLGRHRLGRGGLARGRLERPLGPGRRRRRCRDAGHGRRSRWRRDRHRHGRDVLRRLRSRGRRGEAHRRARDRGPPDPAADGRRPYGRGGRRLDRLARPRRRAAGRPTLGRR